MKAIVSFVALGALLTAQTFSGSHINDHSWTSINCEEFELVIEDSSNYSDDQILLQSGEIKRNDDGEYDLNHCFGVKKFSEDILAFDNYGVSASMLAIGSKPNQDDVGERSTQTSKNFGLMGLIFNFQDKLNYEYVYIT